MRAVLWEVLRGRGGRGERGGSVRVLQTSMDGVCGSVGGVPSSEPSGGERVLQHTMFPI